MTKHLVKVTLDEAEWQLLNDCAVFLGLPLGTFLRTVALQAARSALAQQQRAQAKKQREIERQALAEERDIERQAMADQRAEKQSLAHAERQRKREAREQAEIERMRAQGAKLQARRDYLSGKYRTGTLTAKETESFYRHFHHMKRPH
jgi:flagellar biosynthesis GTPase FlhF